MKVLVVEPVGGAFWYITKAFINAFNDSGIQAKFYNGQDKNIFKKYKPDLYIGCSGHRQVIPTQRDFKVAIHVNPWGKRLEPVFGVDINEPKNAIEWTLEQKPDVVFGYGHQDDENTYWSNWKNWVGVPTAGDATEYYPDKKQVNYDVAFLGGRWAYKGHNIDKWLMPIIKRHSNKVAIHGWGGWQGIKSYKGPLPKGDSGRRFLSSAKVCPCICEPHTSIYGIDIPERFFKVALCGSLPILDKVPGFDRYCDNYLMAQTPEDYYKMVKRFAFNSDFKDKRIEKINLIRKEVLSKHTYHHRMQELCRRLEFDDAVSSLEESISKLT